jgi:glycosyltransferase involved in cell wall biosynthesis
MKNKEKVTKIAIDALGINEVGGARSVTLPLLQKIFKLKQNWSFFCFLTKHEEALDFKNVNQIVLPLSKGLLSRLIFQLIIPIFVVIKKIDLTHFFKSQANIIFGSKKIMTIYDCTILRYPEFFSIQSKLFWKYLQPIICNHMDLIITISQSAKTEIIKFLKVEPEKIRIIYPAPQFDDPLYSSQKEIEIIKSKYKLPEEYLLYIGQIGKKKNLHTLIDAYKFMIENKENIPPLILVGPRYYLSDAGKIFDKIRLNNLKTQINYLGAIKKGELQIILAKAKILLFPSSHEGFGLPLIEALKACIPVISSDTSVMPEVLNGSGVLVKDYLSPKAWAKEIIRLNSDKEMREKLIISGKKRAEDFSWDIAAEKLIKVYESLL